MNRPILPFRLAAIAAALALNSAYAQTTGAAASPEANAATQATQSAGNRAAIICPGKGMDAPIVPFTHLPAVVGEPVLATAPTRVGQDMAVSDRVHEIQVEVSGLADARGMLAADGMSLVPVRIRLLDACGEPVKGKVNVRVDAGGARIAPSPAAEPERLVDPAGKQLGVDELVIVDGSGSFQLIAPSVATEVALSIRTANREAVGKIAFAPDLRPLIAVGVIDGIFNLGKRDNVIVPSAGINDGFDRELKRFQKEFDNGDISLAGRAAFFVKGMIKGDVLLTAAFDSEKETRQRALQDINPDKFYPVLGDSSTKGLEARSADRLYVRLDRGRNYVLYGDFATGEGLSQKTGLDSVKLRDLGQYTRTMTGARAHFEDDRGFVDTFAMYDSLRQAVEEYRGNGTSGPYSVVNMNAVENTEQLEIIVRDRNNTSRILSTTTLVRFVDYTFEPFSGRILLKAPLPSLDESLNPVSLRITYEVDSGGTKYWVYGVSGQARLNDRIEIGGSYVKDDNPGQPAGAGYTTVPGQGTRELRELVSANAGIRVGENGLLVAEVARSDSATAAADVQGNAYRIDWSDFGTWDSPWGTGLEWKARAFWGESEKDFHNPASSYTDGRSEAGVRAAVGLSDRTSLLVDAQHTEDKVADTYRDGQAVRVEHKLDDRWTLSAGVRHIQQSAGAALSFSTSSSNLTLPGQAPVYGGSGLNPAGAGFWGMNIGVDPVTGQPQSMLNGQLIPGTASSQALDAWTLSAGAIYRYNEKLSFGAEVGHDQGLDDDPVWVALSGQYREEDWRLFGRVEAPTSRATVGGDYKLTEAFSLYGRYENSNGLASGYALDSGAEGRAFVLGVKQSDNRGLENFNEYRLRDGMNGEETENATGLRNTFDVRPGLKANLAAEYLNILSGGGRSATALSGGLEWTEQAWRGSARLEWRQLERSAASTTDDTADSWMSTLSLARKLDAEWTGLFRNYLLLSDRNDASGNQLQNRFQVGMAYRPVNRNDFDALMRYENKFERNQEIDPRENRTAHVVSANLNYHPDRSWWYMGRVAAKSVNEDLQGISDVYRAWLLSGRAIVDLSKDFDAGVMASVMGSPQGAARQYAFGVEGGYLLGSNVWGSVGYNFAGFSDKDLTGSDYTSKGIYLRLRIKFDENTIRKAASGFATSL